MIGEIARHRREALERGIAAFRNADAGAAEYLYDALGYAARGGLGSRFDADLAHFYLSELHRIHGFEAMFRNRHFDALRLLEAATGHNPENFQALYGAAICANATGDYAKAIAYLERLFDVERCTRRLNTQIAAVLINAGRLGEAERRLERGLAENPKFADVNHLLGICRFRQRRQDEAVVYLRRAVDADPRFGAARLCLGSALLLTGDTAGAADALDERAHQAKLPDPGRQLFEAVAGLEATSGPGVDDESVAGLRDYAEKLAEDALHARLLIHPLAVGLHVTDDEVGTGQRYDDAHALAYELLLEQVPHHARLHFRCGRLLQRLGREDEARDRYRRALELDPRSRAWPGVAELLGIEPGDPADAPPTGRYDEARDGVSFDWQPGLVPESYFPDRLVRRVGRLRRALDVLVAGGALLLLAPVFLLLALAIKLDSRGPVFFAQKRVGHNGRRFTIYKLRTMYVGAGAQDEALSKLNDADGPLFKIKADPRVTRIGRVLRQRSLDELPQFWNVLCGDMTLLGPRPLIEREVCQMTDWELRRLLVTPGLVCLAQICGRSDLPFHEWIRLDTYYVSRQGPEMDLGIALRGIWSVLAGKGAY